MEKVMNIEKKISYWFKDLFASNYDFKNDHKSNILFNVLFVFICISIFGSIILQIPFFSNLKINKVFEFVWLIDILIMFFLDYKIVLKNIFQVLVLLFPFLVYLVFGLIFKVAFSNAGLWFSVFLSVAIYILFSSFKKYASSKQISFILKVFIAASTVFALLILFLYLFKTDLSSVTYAYGSKNSAGPILFVAILFLLYVSLTEKLVNYKIVFRILLSLLLVSVIFLMKNRAVIIVVPIFIFLVLNYFIKNKKWLYISSGIFVLILVLIFVIPPIRETIIDKILFNNKKVVNLDVLLSGRLTQAAVAFSNFHPVLGDGYSYVDCMPILILCSYGVIGFLSLIPVLIMPFVITYHSKSIININSYRILFLTVLFFAINALFEGNGYLGPGVKVLGLWMILGLLGTNEIFPFEEVNLFFDKTQAYLLSKATPKRTELSFSIVIFVASFAVLSIAPIRNNISEQIISSSSIDSGTSEYIRPDGFSISNAEKVFEKTDIAYIALGQTIDFDVVFNPIDTFDTAVKWGLFDSTSFSVNPTTGEVKALTSERGTYLYAYSLKETSLRNSILIRSVPWTSFEYNSLHITAPKTTLSINESIQIQTNSSYIGQAEYVFVSSDPEIVSISNAGVVKALKKGTSSIFLRITNDAGVFESEKIDFNVTEDVVLRPESTSLSIDECYENVPIKITPVFSGINPDTNFKIRINGVDCEIDDDTVIFKNDGNAIIQIISLEDESLLCEKTVFVNSNKPKQLSIKNDRLILGTITKIDLIVEYENGYSKIADNSDIVLKFEDYGIRAFTNRNGFVKDFFHFAAIKTGRHTIEYTSSYDQNITTSKTLIISKFTQEEYKSVTNIVSLFLAFLLITICLIMGFFTSSNYWWILFIVIDVSIILLFFLIEFSVFSFILFGPLLISIALFFIKLVNTKKGTKFYYLTEMKNIEVKPITHFLSISI